MDERRSQSLRFILRKGKFILRKGKRKDNKCASDQLHTRFSKTDQNGNIGVRGFTK